MEVIIHTLEEISQFVSQLLSYAGERKIFLFEGEIGAGKTTIIQAICHHFQVREYVTSPTYSIINEYSYKNPQTNAEKLIYHIDLYRLKSEREALDIGIEDYLDSENYCFIEWPQLINALLPSDSVKIKIEILEDSSRKILFL